MLVQEVKIQNLKGLHARATSAFVKVSDSFQCEIAVRKGDLSVNGKSIMGLLMLGAALGSVIEITTNGADEESAMQSLIDLVNQKFGEE